jgi:peptide/nickel transport system permease protein
VLRLIVFRLLAFVPTLIAASLVLFIAINVVPGSAAKAALGIDATPQAIARFEHQHGLDRPLHLQYLAWLGGVLRGDFGNSFQNHVPVGPELLARLPVTLELAALAFLIANLIAVPFGALAAYFHQRTADVSITFMATVMGAIPNFWLATLLILLFALTLRWLPAGGYVPFFDDPLRNLEMMVMPALSLGIVSSALLLRIMRASVLEVLSSDYIRTARAKGASQSAVIWRHAMRNALIPFLTVGAVEFGFLFGGVVIIEDMFLLPGIGSLVLVGIINRDYPVLLAAALVITVVVLTANMVVDLIGSILDPRQVHARSGQ